MHLIIRYLVAAAAVVLAPLACAQAWPAKPVRLVVNVPPGGTVDVVARIGAELVVASPEEFAARQQRERDRFGAIIRAANIRVE